jgi:hypothetical protein
MDVIKIRRYVAKDEDNTIWNELSEWCIQQFGMPGELDQDWYYRTNVNYMDFYFLRSRDAELFVMKWM